jgi:hypothetical protein
VGRAVMTERGCLENSKQGLNGRFLGGKGQLKPYHQRKRTVFR